MHFSSPKRPTPTLACGARVERDLAVLGEIRAGSRAGPGGLGHNSTRHGAL